MPMRDATPMTVSALVRRGDTLLLVQEQGPRDAAPIWMLPGGRVEDGEAPEAAVRRELAEETGLVVVGMPQVAFAVEIEADLQDLVGRWRARTYACDATGTIAPADPDELIVAADWVQQAEALERLEAVEWYDSAPLRSYLGGSVDPGTSFRYRLSGRRGSVYRSIVEVLDAAG